MIKKVAITIAVALASLGFNASPAHAIDDLGPHHGPVKHVIVEQHCYRTVTDTYRRYAGRYWVRVHRSTVYHLNQCHWGYFGR